MRRGMLPYIMILDYLGECSHWWYRGRAAQPTSDENLCYITDGNSLVNEAILSRPGSPNSPSCSALAWYRCWPGLYPSGESDDRTPVARTAALTRYHCATQQVTYFVQLLYWRGNETAINRFWAAASSVCWGCLHSNTEKHSNLITKDNKSWVF